MRCDFNQAVCGLRFLYEVTLDKPWAVRHIPFGKRPKKLPTVLSDQEVSRLLQCVKNPKHRAVLLTCYAAGLRLSECTHLRIPDIDGQRAQIRITSGKGSKERRVPASPRLLQELREYPDFYDLELRRGRYSDLLGPAWQVDRETGVITWMEDEDCLLRICFAELQLGLI